MRTLLVPLLAAAALGGCATTQPDGVQVADASARQDDVVCFYEAATGTNRKVRRCMSKEEYKRNTETAQRLAGEIKMPPPEQR